MSGMLFSKFLLTFPIDCFIVRIIKCGFDFTFCCRRNGWRKTAAVGRRNCPDRAERVKGMLPIKKAKIEKVSTVLTESDGDLWPCAWGDDDMLYTANGDGKGFDLSAPWTDIVVNRIEGMPGSLKGERLTGTEGVGPVFADPEKYNRKPTGMLCAGGVLYLAVQNLNKCPEHGIFDDAPCATICMSRDKGHTWEFDPKAPMFDHYQFTTIMFLDYGKNNEASPDGYVYAYGLDYNWRASFCKSVKDPVNLFLARVEPSKVMDREAWEFFAGQKEGKPVFVRDISQKVPVLTDTRRVPVKPPKDLADKPMGMSVISQGSVVYNAPLQRYLYTSWTENTFEFYESPTPWGPFTRFFSYNFGFYPWGEECYGGYATVIPSKFISEDGKTMYVVSATFAGGVKSYAFHMRRLQVEL